MAADTRTAPSEPIGGVSRTVLGARWRADEPSTEFIAPRLYRTVDQMVRTDTVVRAALLMVVLPLQSAVWSVQAGGTGPRDEEAAALARTALFDLLQWPQVVWDLAMPAMKYGHGLAELVAAPTELALTVDGPDGQRVTPRRAYWGVRIAARAPHTISRWDVDEHGDLRSVDQDIDTPTTRRRVTIPGDRLVLWTNERSGPGDVLGTSILRSAYRSWFVKEKLEVIDAIRSERAGVGVPVAWDGDRPGEGARLTEALSAIRANEDAVLVLPGSRGVPDSPHVEMLDMRASSNASVEAGLRYHTTQILWSVFSAWQQLGQDGTGARATADTQSGPFYLLLQALADQLAQVIGRQVLPRLTEWNFAGAAPPVVTAGGITHVDAGAVVSHVAQAINAGLITTDDALERHIRDVLDLPAPPATDGDTAETSPLSPDQASLAAQRLVSASGGPVMTDAEARALLGLPPREATPEVALSSAPSVLLGQAREPNEFEARHVALDAITQGVPEARDRAAGAISAQVEALAASAADTPEGWVPPSQLVDSLAAAVSRGCAQAVDFGRATVRSEMASQQGERVGLTGLADTERVLAGVPEVAGRVREWIAQRSRAAAQGIAQRIRQAADTIGLTPGEVPPGDRLDRLRALAQQAARAEIGDTVGTAFAVGRYEATRASGAERAVYSSVLDFGTCDPCASKDGQEYTVGSPEYEADYPPNMLCQGGPRCRCLMIVHTAG